MGGDPDGAGGTAPQKKLRWGGTAHAAMHPSPPNIFEK